MTAEEVKSVIDEQRAQGLTDENMLDAFYDMFKDGKMSKDDLKNVIGVMGYEFTPEFEQDNTESPIDAKEGEAQIGDENVTKEEIEDAKEFEPGEDSDENAESAEDNSEETSDSEEETEETSETEDNGEEETEEESEEDEKSRAKKLFGLDN